MMMMMMMSSLIYDVRATFVLQRILREGFVKALWVLGPAS